MIQNEQVRSDIQEIMKIGTDEMIYIDLATFLNQVDSDPRADRIKRSIADVAWLIRILEEQ